MLLLEKLKAASHFSVIVAVVLHGHVWKYTVPKTDLFC